MKLIDYTGKLNSHTEYIKVLEKLEKYTAYVEIVIHGENIALVNKLKNNIIVIKKVSSWWGTRTKSVNNLYKIEATSQLFELLKKYETFCKYYDANIYKEKEYDEVEITDFGIDDIAFYDKNNEYLLFTTTHEGYITINEKIIS